MSHPLATQTDDRGVLARFLARDLANFDMDWVSDVAKAIDRLDRHALIAMIDKIRMARVASAARRQAWERLGKAHPVSEELTYRALRDHLSAFQDEFHAEWYAYEHLRAVVAELARLDIVHHTGHGKDALDRASLKLESLIGESHKLARAQFDPLVKLVGERQERDGRSGVDPVDPALYADSYAPFHEQWLLMIERALLTIDEVEISCKQALEFSAIKAYVHEHPGTTLDAVKKGVIALQQGVGAVGAGATVAKGVEAELAVRALEVAEAVMSAGVSFLGKALIAATAADQVERIRKNQTRYQEVIGELNRNPLMVAEYLAEKYVENLKYNFEMVEPLVLGSNLLIGAAAEIGGPAAAKLANIKPLWTMVTDAVLKTVEGYQQARIARAKQALAGVKADASAMTVAARTVAQYWGATQKNMVDLVRANVFAVMDPMGLMARAAIRAFIETAVEKIMVGLSVDPAQQFDGTTLQSYLDTLTDSRLKARTLREGRVYDRLLQPLRDRVARDYPFSDFHDSCAANSLSRDEDEAARALLAALLARLRLTVLQLDDEKIEELGERVRDNYGDEIVKGRRLSRYEHFADKLIPDGGDAISVADSQKLTRLVNADLPDDRIHREMGIATFPFG